MKTKTIIITLSITIILAVIINNKMTDNRIKLNKVEYDTCIIEARKVYDSSWDNTCMLNHGTTDCGIDYIVSEQLKQTHEENKTRCLEIYKVNLLNK